MMVLEPDDDTRLKSPATYMLLPGPLTIFE